ncbi:hypothetical protein [Bradyrhizobium shewense]|uniref:hypothetical protein n=1 Tax=Bradyrhizobium shewense TaxID=1761772 RepID=UPI0013F630C6
MHAYFGNSGPPEQAFTFCSSGQLTGLLFELGYLFCHSFFKGAGLFHSLALLAHSALLEQLTTNLNAEGVYRFEVWNKPGASQRLGLVFAAASL